MQTKPTDEPESDEELFDTDLPITATDHEQEENLGEAEEVNFFHFVKINKQCIENLLRSSYTAYTEALGVTKTNNFLKHRGTNFKQFAKMAKSFGMNDYEKDIGEIRDHIFGPFVAKLPADKDLCDIKLKLILDFLLNEFLGVFKYPNDWANRKW